MYLCRPLYNDLSISSEALLPPVHPNIVSVALLLVAGHDHPGREDGGHQAAAVRLLRPRVVAADIRTLGTHEATVGATLIT